MTHRNSPHLTHITSPHKQPDCFISPRNRPHDIKTSQIATTAHHHHGTAEGSFTAKKWFGHRAGRSPCAHSIGKFFLCYIVLFSSETSAPGSPGNYLYTVGSFVFCLKDTWKSVIDSTGTLTVVQLPLQVKMTRQHELGSAQLWTATYPARLGTCNNQFWCWEGNNFATHKVHSGNLIAKGESTGSRSRRTEHLLRMRKARCVPAAVAEQLLLLYLLLSPWSMRLHTESKHLLGRTHNRCTPTHLHISWWHTQTCRS